MFFWIIGFGRSFESFFLGGYLGGFFDVLYSPFYFYVSRKKLALGFTYPSFLITVAVRLLKILLNVFFLLCVFT